ncbi:MAG: hypothetical protein WD775_11075 [Burkholderiales bacterium]
MKRTLLPAAVAAVFVTLGAQAERLPATLGEALAALREDACLKEGLGAQFVDYYCRIKQAEIARFNLEASDWEQREYFDLF